MKKTMLLFTFSILIGMTVYAQKPKADFDVTVKYNCREAVASYTNKSVGAVQYFWSYDNLNYSEYKVPYDIYFESADSIKITLIAVAQDGQRDTLTKAVNIDSPTTAIIKYNKSDSELIAPVTVQFFNESYLHTGDDSLSYSWNFGYGIDLNEKNPTRYFETPGTYYVSLSGKSATCETSAYATINVKDTAQRGEFSFIKSSCNQDYYTFVPVEKHYQVLNDTLKIFGMYYGNCGATKTATIRYNKDTIIIKTWELGPFTTCSCEFYFEINIPHYSKDSAIVLFNGERLKTGVSAIPKINQLDKSIHIYPNPISDNFQLESDDNSIFPLTIIIKDLNGRKIHENIVNTTKTNINTSVMKSGIYILNLYSKQGYVTKKIIKI